MESSGMLKFRFKGKVRIGKEEFSFTKEVEGKSEKHALDVLYSLFGSKNGVKRTKIKVEEVERL